MKALVLSGGGARGDFEVGAVRFLYNQGFRPDIISGASVGAINGIKLAEGEPTSPNSTQGLSGLERIWLALQVPSHMFVEEPWVQQLGPILREALVSSGVLKASVPSASERLIEMFVSPGIFGPVSQCLEFCGEIDALRKLLASPSPPKAIFNLSPIRSKLNDPVNLDLGKVTSSGIRLRLGLVGLESGDLASVTESGDLLRLSGPKGLKVGLVDAVMASASIPGMFPPVKLGDEWFVDGGVRDPVPIDAAVTAGATEVFAVAASASVHRADSFDTANLLGITARAVMEIMTDETVRNELNPPSPWSVPITIIRPTVDLHDITEIDPGFISITMAYGYMRAFDVVNKRSPTDCVDTDEIVLLRKAIWELEQRAFGAPLPGETVSSGSEATHLPDLSSISQVREKKLELRARVNDRRYRLKAQSLPSDAEMWHLAWERHAWSPPMHGPWEGLVVNHNTVFPPAPLRPDARIGVIRAGAGAVKERWLKGTWVAEGANVASLGLSGDRVAIVGGGRERKLRAKEGPLDAPWADLLRDVNSFVLSGNRIAALTTAGALRATEGSLDAPWTDDLLGDVKSIALSGSRIVALSTDGVLRAKEGPLNAPWTDLLRDVEVFAAIGSTIVGVTSPNGAISIQDGHLDSPWVPQPLQGVQSVQISAVGVAALTTSGASLFLRPRATLPLPGISQWLKLKDGVESFRLSGMRVAVLLSQGMVLEAMEFTWPPLWVKQSDGVGAFALSGNRIAIITADEHRLLAKEGSLVEAWVDLGTGVDRVWLSSPGD
jgi:hypothetical protein